jgi:hypothetical protein
MELPAHFCGALSGWRPAGHDRVEFYLSANPENPLVPLVQVASAVVVRLMPRTSLERCCRKRRQC